MYPFDKENSLLKFLEFPEKLIHIDAGFENFNIVKPIDIQNFITFIEGGNIDITVENVAALDSLAKKYLVATLSDITLPFIEDNKKEIINYFFTTVFEEEHTCSYFYEQLLVADLDELIIDEFMNDDRLFNLSIACLFRIIEQYQKKKTKESDTYIVSLDLIKLVFKALDRFDYDGSVFLSIVPVGPDENFFLKTLIENYPKAQLSFLKEDHFRFLYQKCKLLE